MEMIMTYFETIPSLHRSIILVGGLTFFWILEGSLFSFQLCLLEMETCPSQSVFYTHYYCH